MTLSSGRLVWETKWSSTWHTTNLINFVVSFTLVGTKLTNSINGQAFFTTPYKSQDDAIKKLHTFVEKINVSSVWKGWFVTACKRVAYPGDRRDISSDSCFSREARWYVNRSFAIYAVSRCENDRLIRNWVIRIFRYFVLIRFTSRLHGTPR